MGTSGLGIDLPFVGVTPNDPCDSVRPQNFPVITSGAVSSGNVTLSGTLNSVASTQFRLEFFSSAVSDPSGFGEGEKFLGSTNVVTDASCNATFGPISLPFQNGQIFVAATATRLETVSLNPLETSEFSATVQVVPTPLRHRHQLQRQRQRRLQPRRQRRRQLRHQLRRRHQRRHQHQRQLQLQRRLRRQLRHRPQFSFSAQ